MVCQVDTAYHPAFAIFRGFNRADQELSRLRGNQAGVRRQAAGLQRVYLRNQIGLKSMSQLRSPQPVAIVRDEAVIEGVTVLLLGFWGCKRRAGMSLAATSKRGPPANTELLRGGNSAACTAGGGVTLALVWACCRLSSSSLPLCS